MRTRLNTILIAFLAFLLTTAIVGPSLIKFSHFFLEHSHVECNEHVKTHFHESDFDCKLFKFHHTHQINFFPESITFEIFEIPSQKNFNSYSFVSEFQQLHFSLRGPPLV